MNRNFRNIFDRRIVITSLKVALVVGTILNLINQWQSIIEFDYEHISIPKMMLTFCVPYLVSTYSAVVTKISN
jgi:hypothetical protein